MKLHARIRGTGKPLILLHGLFGASDNLSSLANHLSQYYQVHSLDARNHGRSDRSEKMDYSAMASDVIQYMDESGIVTCSVIGHSMGGKCAMELALAHPKRIEALIVADIAPEQYESHHTAIFSGLSAVNLATIQSRQEADASMTPFIDEASVRQFLLKSLYKNNNGKYDWRFNLKVIHKCYHAILAGLEPARDYTGPVLFIAGERSDYISQSSWSTIKKLFPDASIKMMQGAGHWLHAEKPKTFNLLCEKFLKLNA